jgi:hypothetical protein
MQKQQDWNQLIGLLEQTAHELKDVASHDISVEQALAQLGNSFSELLHSLKQIENQQDGKHKLEVYANIAKFVESTIAQSDSEHSCCLSAVLLVCGEREQNSLSNEPPSEKVAALASKIKKTIIGIRVHYHRTLKDSCCSRKTDIFFVRPGTKKPIHNRIEEEIYWDSLPADLRSAFISEGQEKISFQLYP